MLERVELTEWTLERRSGPEAPVAVGTRLPATVPGTVHTDLRAADRIPEPTASDNERHLGWIGRSEWRYSTTIGPVAGRRVALEFAGIDTAATITLGGRVLADVVDMHRSWTLDVTDDVARAASESLDLVVDFAAPELHALAERERLGTYPNAYPEPFNAVRKMACNFGWDWGPKLVTAGLWRPVSRVSWTTARLAGVTPLVDLVDSTGVAIVRVVVERDPGRLGTELTVSAGIGDRIVHAHLAPGECETELRLEVDDVEAWWPVGLGAPTRHELTVGLVDAESGEPLDDWRRMIGFRHVEIETTPDAEGTPFVVTINGRPVFVRGANWIPDRPFPHLVDADRYRRRVADAVAANMNLLRIWGGGVYESDAFYDACDAAGVMVFQDFPFACAAYPEDEGTRSQVEAEARENVRRLASHPSLALWCGNNENIWGFWDWGWPDELEGRPWGRGYYEQLLPTVVHEEDPTRPYWPGSPFSGSWDVHPNDPNHGTAHLWEVWNDLDYTEYRRSVPRFVAEYGFQGPAEWATLAGSIGPDELAVGSPVMAVHQKADNGDAKLQRALDLRYPPVGSFDDWHFLTRVEQARAFALGIEHFRSHRGRCMGSIIWQLNDCWPVVSWSIVDGDERRKPAWFAVRRAYEPRLVSIQPEGSGLVVALVDDTDGRDGDWSGTLTIERVTFGGEVVDSIARPVVCEAPGAIRCPVPTNLSAGLDAGEVIVARVGERRGLWFVGADRDQPLAPAELDVSVGDDIGGLLLTMRASTLVRDLVVSPDRIDPSWSCDDGLITLLPGESVTLRVAGARRDDLERLCSAPVLRCVNDVVAGPTVVNWSG